MRYSSCSVINGAFIHSQRNFTIAVAPLLFLLVQSTPLDEIRRLENQGYVGSMAESSSEGMVYDAIGGATGGAIAGSAAGSMGAIP